jgi:hypothetical protein
MTAARRFHTSRNRRTGEALDRVRQAAAQLQPAAAKVKPLAGAREGGRKARSAQNARLGGTAGRVHSQVLEDSVAPKVSALLSSVA